MGLVRELSKGKEGRILFELQVGGAIERWGTQTTEVTTDAGGCFIYDGIILNKVSVGASFDFKYPRYSVTNISFTIDNKEQIQKLEKSQLLEGAAGTVFIWFPGMTREQMLAHGVLASGEFRKDWHSKKEYRFTLIDPVRFKIRNLPGRTIDAKSWPSHRTKGGGGAVGGEAAQIVFGNFPIGIPLLCINTSSYKYLLSIEHTLSSDADYTATVDNVYDKDGGVIGAAGYALKYEVDNLGFPTSIIDFTGNKSSSEPLSVSVRGLSDAHGFYTGTVDALIENPSHIIHWLLDFNSSLSHTEIDHTSLATLGQLLPEYKFAVLINQAAAGVDVIDRILSQCFCARTTYQGKFSIVVFDLNAPGDNRIYTDDDAVSPVTISSVNRNDLVNNLLVLYGFDATTKTYSKALSFDQTNSSDCRHSVLKYGEQPRRELRLVDVQNDGVAFAVASRFLSIYAYVRNIINVRLRYDVAFDYRLGDMALFTVPEGSSDGGWVDEKCMLLSNKYTTGYIQQQWLQVAVN